MTVEDAVEFFKHIPKIHQIANNCGCRLRLCDIGAASNYFIWWRSTADEASSELHKNSNGKNFYILDEPTTGLHTDDIARLLLVLERLVEAAILLVIEHNLDVIKSADHVIDLGPEGGDGGGTIVATGTPEEVAKVKDSYTGYYLKRVLK